MSDPPDHLLIDIGNSRIKYACLAAGNALGQIHVIACIDDLVEQVRASHEVFVASVGHVNQVEALRLLCQRENKPLFIAKTTASAMGIQCAYTQYENLGVDRWLGILAARSKSASPLCVISLGTAITCDFVVGDQHLGGWISPGFDLMRESVVTRTHNVFADIKRPTRLEPGKSTQSCVNGGCLAAMLGVISQARSEVEQLGKEADIFVTGGNQQMVKEALAGKVNYEANLVLQGLALFAQKNSQHA